MGNYHDFLASLTLLLPDYQELVTNFIMMDECDYFGERLKSYQLYLFIAGIWHGGLKFQVQHY